MPKLQRIPCPPEWAEAITRWENHLKAARRSRGTVNTRRYPVIRVAWAFRKPPEQVTTQDLEQWLAELEVKPETAYGYRSGIRSFFKYCYANGITTADPAASLPTIIRPATVPQPCPDDAISKALHNPDDRVRIMLRLAAEHGLRRGEIAILRGGDLETKPNGLALLIRGKGGKQRYAYIEEYERDIIAAFKEAGDGYLFPGQIDGHLSPQHCGLLMSRALPNGYGAHKLRTRFATTAYAQNHDLLTLQRILGHANPLTTERYIRASEDAPRTMTRAARLK
jgi:integrase